MNARLITLTAVVASITACGGGGGDDSSPDPAPDPGFSISPNFSVNDTSSYELQKPALRLVRRFGLNGSSPCACFYHAVVFSDFDSDGDTDVFMSGGSLSRDRTPVEVYLNDGADNFTFDNSIIAAPGPGVIHPRKALSGDFNGDGQTDVFIAAHGEDVAPFPGEHPALYLSGANGLEYDNSLEPNVGFYHSAASADIDADGDIDIFVGDVRTPFFLINDGFGRFTRNTERLTNDVNDKQIFTAELIDIDGDGYTDLFLAGHEFEGMETTIYWGSESGSYLSTNRTLLPAIAGQGVVLDIDVEDLDNDGRSDIVLTRTGGGGTGNFYSGYYLQLLEGAGAREFVDATQSIAMNSGTERTWIDWVSLTDFDGDGYLDIVEDDAISGYVWLNNGAGAFSR